MSVLIKGMEMPENCYECWALDECGDYPMCRITGEQRGYNFNVHKNKMDKCPLVEVHTPHGRLKDGDALMELAQNCIYKTVDCNDIARVPTVVEAEEG